MRGKLSIWPSTAAAKARTSIVTPSALPIGKLDTPARRNTVTNASTVVMTQTVVWMRPTGTPSVAARSERSAAARIAIPTRAYTQEEREGEQDQRDEDEDHQVVVVEEDAADLHLDVERRIEHRAADGLEAEPAGHEQRERGEELRDADRRHGEHEPRRPAEPVDDRPFDDEAEEHGRDQTDDEGDGVGEPGHPVRRAARCVLGDEQDREDRRDRAEIALREVHDAVRAVDERDADGEERGERADERALDDDAERRAEEDIGDIDQDDGRDRERQDAQPAAPRCGRTRRGRPPRRGAAAARCGSRYSVTPQRRPTRRHQRPSQTRTGLASAPPVRLPQSDRHHSSRSSTEMMASTAVFRAAGTSRGWRN